MPSKMAATLEAILESINIIARQKHVTFWVIIFVSNHAQTVSRVKFTQFVMPKTQVFEIFRFFSWF